jgi:hypothetical protein
MAGTAGYGDYLCIPNPENSVQTTENTEGTEKCWSFLQYCFHPLGERPACPDALIFLRVLRALRGELLFLGQLHEPAALTIRIPESADLPGLPLRNLR